jgi:hypothetical protein
MPLFCRVTEALHCQGELTGCVELPALPMLRFGGLSRRSDLADSFSSWATFGGQPESMEQLSGAGIEIRD